MERFWAKVDCSAGPDECWPWTGATRNGYGAFRVNGRTEGAHRVAYVLTHGHIAPEAEVMHSCDNPPCCNPGHLRSGPHAENMADMAAKGRNRTPIYRGAEHPRARLSDEQVATIRRRTGESKAALGREFGVSGEHIGRIQRGQARP